MSGGCRRRREAGEEGGGGRVGMDADRPNRERGEGCGEGEKGIHGGINKETGIIRDVGENQ